MENGVLKLNVKPKQKPVEDYLKSQNRFRHLTDDQIQWIQGNVDEKRGMLLEYDGTELAGSQAQAAVRTVQGELEEAARELAAGKSRTTRRRQGSAHRPGFSPPLNTSESMSDLFIITFSIVVTLCIRSAAVSREHP